MATMQRYYDVTYLLLVAITFICYNMTAMLCILKQFLQLDYWGVEEVILFLTPLASLSLPSLLLPSLSNNFVELTLRFQ
jgi:hypothetical protein